VEEICLEYHPDKNPHLRAEEKFKEINHAYQTITKEQKMQAKESENAAHVRAKLDKKPQGPRTKSLR